MSNARSCPHCTARNTECIDGRQIASGAYRRRRVCNSCGKSWTTYEVAVPRDVTAKAFHRRLAEFMEGMKDG